MESPTFSRLPLTAVPTRNTKMNAAAAASKQGKAFKDNLQNTSYACMIFVFSYGGLRLYRICGCRKNRRNGCRDGIGRCIESTCSVHRCTAIVAKACVLRKRIPAIGAHTAQPASALFTKACIGRVFRPAIRTDHKFILSSWRVDSHKSIITYYNRLSRGTQNISERKVFSWTKRCALFRRSVFAFHM